MVHQFSSIFVCVGHDHCNGLGLCTIHQYIVIPVFFNTVHTGIFHTHLYGSPYGSM